MMIQNKKDLRLFLEADRISLGIRRKRPSIFMLDFTWKWERLLRKVEYYHNCRVDFIGKIICRILVWRFRRLSVFLGLDIPINTFGPGLSIAHGGKIVVNPKVRVGRNCRIHCDVVLGQGHDAEDVPHLKDNVHIGPGVKILGGINIGNNTVIAANAVVTKSFPEGDCTIGGIPAKIISQNTSLRNERGRLVICGYELAKGECGQE